MTAAPLVVNADDLGLTRGVNAGIRRAHLAGVVTSTSLLAVGREFDDAAAMLRATPSLALGAHLALVGEDPPVLSAREVPSLVDRRGRFPLTYRVLLARCAAGAVDPNDVRRELTAQLERVAGVGVPVSHLDAHQHVHLWPMVGRIVVDLARARGIGLVRLPRAHRIGPMPAGVNLLSAALARRIAAAGLATCDYAGLDEAGAMTEPAIRRSLRALARRRGGSGRPAEINLHPALVGDERSRAELARFDWGYRWQEELDAACAPATRQAVADHGYRLVSWADLAPRAGQVRRGG